MDLSGDRNGANGAPRPESSAEPSAEPSSLPPRLRDLYRAIAARGHYSTHDHMEQHALSHRTALRDLQTLVASGLIERIGSRRGAFYRPADRNGRIVDESSRPA